MTSMIFTCNFITAISHIFYAILCWKLGSFFREKGNQSGLIFSRKVVCLVILRSEFEMNIW